MQAAGSTSTGVGIDIAGETPKQATKNEQSAKTRYETRETLSSVVASYTDHRLHGKHASRPQSPPPPASSSTPSASSSPNINAAGQTNDSSNGPRDTDVIRRIVYVWPELRDYLWNSDYGASGDHAASSSSSSSSLPLSSSSSSLHPTSSRHRVAALTDTTVICSEESKRRVEEHISRLVSQTKRHFRASHKSRVKGLPSKDIVKVVRRQMTDQSFFSRSSNHTSASAEEQILLISETASSAPPLSAADLSSSSSSAALLPSSQPAEPVSPRAIQSRARPHSRSDACVEKRRGSRKFAEPLPITITDPELQLLEEPDDPEQQEEAEEREHASAAAARRQTGSETQNEPEAKIPDSSQGPQLVRDITLADAGGELELTSDDPADIHTAVAAVDAASSDTRKVRFNSRAPPPQQESLAPDTDSPRKSLDGEAVSRLATCKHQRLWGHCKHCLHEPEQQERSFAVLTASDPNAPVNIYGHWDFTPVLRHPWLRRIAISRWIIAIFFLFVCTWLGVVVLGQTSNSGLTSFLLIWAAGFISVGFSLMDRKLVLAVLGAFEWQYIMFHALLFLVMGIYGQSDTSLHSPSLAAGYFGAFFISHFFVSLTDAVSIQTLTFLRLFWMLAGAIFSLHYLFNDRVTNTPLLESYQACLVFCADTRVLASFAIVQLLAFYCKYTWHTARDWYIGRPQFVLLSLPVYCKVITSSLMQEEEEETTAEPSRTHQPSQSHNSSPALPWALRVGQIVRTGTVQLFSRLARRKYRDTDVIYVTTRLSAAYLPPNANVAYLHRSFIFRPLNSMPWAVSFARAPSYVPFLILMFCFEFASAFYRDNYNVFEALWVAVPLTVAFFEYTRYDRTLISAVIRRFEWWIFFLALWQSAIFSLWSQTNYRDTFSLVAGGVNNIVLGLLVVLLDAAPTYPPLLKFVALLFLLIGDCALSFTTRFTPMDSVPICIIFCADSRTLSLSAYLTKSIYILKYLVSIVLRKHDRCVLIRTRIAFSVHKVYRSPAPTDPSISGDLELQTPNKDTLTQSDKGIRPASASPVPMRDRSTSEAFGDWATCYDDNGARFFHNRVTGQSVWELPD